MRSPRAVVIVANQIYQLVAPNSPFYSDGPFNDDKYEFSAGDAMDYLFETVATSWRHAFKKTAYAMSLHAAGLSQYFLV